MPKQNQETQQALFTGPHQFNMEGWIACAPFEKHLQMTILEAAQGRARLCMPFIADLAQGSGLMHGGALVSLADTAVALAIKSLVAPGTHFATISLESKFLRGVKSGTVTAQAVVQPLKGRELSGRAMVYDDQKQPVMEFESRFRIARDAGINGVSFKQEGAAS